MIERRQVLSGAILAGAAATVASPANACRDLLVLAPGPDGNLQSIPEVADQIRAVATYILSEERSLVQNEESREELNVFAKQVRKRMAATGAQTLSVEMVDNFGNGETQVHTVNFKGVGGRRNPFDCDDNMANNHCILVFSDRVLVELHPMQYLNKLGVSPRNG